MFFLFLDTNIFIHFIDFDQVDWNKIVQTKEQCIVTIAPIVIEELDKHKYNKNSKIARRVKRLLPKIEDKNTKKEINIITGRPKNDTFNDNHLDKIDQDDCLLASILEFLATKNVNDKVLYVTNDTGPRLKAKSLLINCINLDESYLLPNELDEVEKKNKELESELKKYKNALPKVGLTFENDSDFFVAEEKANYKSKDEFVEFCIEEEKKKLDYFDIENSDKHLFEKKASDALAEIMKNSFGSLTNDQKNQYNKKLDEYLNECVEYFESIYDKGSYLNDCIKINLVLYNKGTAPAHDIDVALHFPDGFALHTKDGLPQVIDKPKLPYKPKHMFDYGNFNAPLLMPYSNRAYTPNIDLYKPTIKKTNSYNVDFHFKSLKHNQDTKLESLYAKYDDRSTAQNFSIEYKLMIGNFPDVVEGSLNVKAKTS